MSRLLRLLLCLLPSSLLAQFTYVQENDIPVRDINNELLAMPWAGGLNASQYNVMDLNMDGKDDLVLFDRTADKVITFLNQDNAYVPAPEYESFFPDDVTNWLLLRDANCDGRKDIFTGNNLGIKVYMNVTEAGEALTWKHFQFFSGISGGMSPVLLTKGFSGKVNLQLQFDDLPAIVDADGDGDLDIFNVRFVGNGTVEYHRNLSMEKYGSCDSLDFERITQKWGNFTECNCGTFAFNGASCPPSTGGRTQHAGGKSLLAFDANGDSKLDLLLSEASCSNLFLLQNEGSVDSPVISGSSVYPPTHFVDFLIFPAAFYEDLDFDGVKDLVAIPNIFTKTFLQSDLANSNWFYKNNGSTSSPSFAFSQTDFLQGAMIDVGDNAVPAFADQDGDGDYDLFISQNTSANVPATVRLYENTGTAASPEFKLIDNDIWMFSQSSFFNLKIQFADINHDGRLDLVFTGTSFQTGSTKLYYIPGTGAGIVDFTGQSLVTTDVTIASSENIYVADIDRDGFSDLLIGRVNGALEFWKSRADGTVTFDISDHSFLGLSSTVLRQNVTCFIADLDANGKADLAYGDQNGKLFIVSNFREATDAAGAVSEIEFNALKQDHESKNLGGRIWPTAVNLFNATLPAIVVGNVLGGVTLLRHQEGQDLPGVPVIEIYPNPAYKNDLLTIKIDRPATIQIFSTLGQVITPPFYLLANEEYGYSVSSLAAGLYIIRFTVEHKTYSRRVIVR